MTRKRRYSNHWVGRLEPLDHWILYWHQLKLMEGVVEKDDTVVEIGVGSGFLSNYLRSKGVQVITLDVDPNKAPDIFIDAVDFYPKRSFDFLCAFEVFEHMEFHEMGQIIDNIGGKLKKGCFVSVPSLRKSLVRLDARLPIFHCIKFDITMPKRTITSKHHHWELGFKNFDEARFLCEFETRGFLLRKRSTFRKWHFFFWVKPT